MALSEHGRPLGIPHFGRAWCSIFDGSGLAVNHQVQPVALRDWGLFLPLVIAAGHVLVWEDVKLEGRLCLVLDDELPLADAHVSRSRGRWRLSVLLLSLLLSFPPVSPLLEQPDEKDAEQTTQRRERADSGHQRRVLRPVPPHAVVLRRPIASLWRPRQDDRPVDIHLLDRRDPLSPRHLLSPRPNCKNGVCPSWATTTPKVAEASGLPPWLDLRPTPSPSSSSSSIHSSESIGQQTSGPLWPLRLIVGTCIVITCEWARNRRESG
eukprot:2282849-Rhodomonas_salina.1